MNNKTILDVYGMNPVITNFVRNELTVDRSISTKEVFKRASEFFKNEQFDIIDISDLIHHLASSMFKYS